jgi:nucleoside-diphosphate-sugar epimerase
MRVLIVGCGYVGLPLAKELAGRGHEVFGLRRSSGTDAELRESGITPVQADITNSQTLAGCPNGFDWVVNCAATGGGSAEEYRRLYLEGTRNLINWLVPAGAPRFVYTSSTGVYGQTDGSVVTESSPADPAAETAKVLVQTENVLLDAAQKRNLPAIILRVAGIYGPGRAYLLKQFLAGEARIEGDGGRLLNMIHREDLVRIIIAALEQGMPGQVYNAVDDEPVSQLEFFTWLAGKLQKPLPPTSPAEPGRRRGITNKRVSNRKLKTQLGYHFKHPHFRTGYADFLKSGG